MNWLVLLLIILIFAGVGVSPHWGYSAEWGYGPSGLVGLLIVILILRLIGLI